MSVRYLLQVQLQRRLGSENSGYIGAGREVGATGPTPAVYRHWCGRRCHDRAERDGASMGFTMGERHCQRTF